MDFGKRLSLIRAGCKQACQIIFAYIGLKPAQLTKSLAHFYSSQSEKRSNTRKKDRPEFDHMLQDVSSYIQETVVSDEAKKSKKKTKKIHIVELGCGDGRFADYLDNNLDVPFSYVGIDCAKGLIDIAKKRNYKNDVEFFIGDMVQYLLSLEQESVDIIISIASIQHLHKSLRQHYRNNAYRVLTYQGLHITTNRSYSRWMLSKHRDTLIIGMILQLLNHRTFGRHDYMIPFKTPGKASEVDDTKNPWEKALDKAHAQSIKTDYRFYHIYLLGELIARAHTAGFVIPTSGYISSEGKMIDNRKESRNTYVVTRKDVGI